MRNERLFRHFQAEKISYSSQGWRNPDAIVAQGGTSVGIDVEILPP